MKLLVCCEESQTVCKMFRSRGWEAYSCDILEESGGHPEWHIKQDVIPLINGDCKFTTCDGKEHEIIGEWDLLICHPPCTYLTSAGTRHFSPKCNSLEKIKEREEKRQEAFDFFMQFVNAKCNYIVIENPVGYVNTHYQKPNQIIHPYYFAVSKDDKENYVQKRTCLWLKNLPNLQYDKTIEKPKPMYICQGEKRKGKPIGWCEGIRGTHNGQKGRSIARSKTFSGIAQAMADQWGSYLERLEVNK